MQRRRWWLGHVVSRLLEPPVIPSAKKESDPEPPVLAYIEQTLADSYRKEIDQEENVWRSMPFFAATLALQVTALVQILNKFPNPATVFGSASSGLLALAALLDLVALGFLSLSIWPRRFNYIASEPDLLAYAEELIRHEEERKKDESPRQREVALVALKWELARQYAVGADHNRQINKRRERWRNRAGLAIVFSVLVTFFLVATTYGQYLYNHLLRDTGHAAVHRSNPAPVRSHTRPYPEGDAVQSRSASAAAHAGGG
jgi:hypothetical protein